MKLTVILPLSLQHTTIRMHITNWIKALPVCILIPRLSVKYQSGIENYFTASYGFRNQIGNIQDVYRGSILTNYRSIMSNNADLTERQSQTAGLGFNYHKAITLFFFSLNANYSHIYANTISSSILNNNITQRIVLPFDNNIDTWNFSGSISKYSILICVPLSANAGYSKPLRLTKYKTVLLCLTIPYQPILV
jgi:hypothetical protein